MNQVGAATIIDNYTTLVHSLQVLVMFIVVIVFAHCTLRSIKGSSVVHATIQSVCSGALRRRHQFSASVFSSLTT